MRECSTSDYVVAYDRYLARNGCADSTRKKYRQHLGEFTAWLGERAPGSLSRGDLENYFDHWDGAFEDRNGRSPAPATSRHHVTSLKGFFRYLEEREHLRDTDGQPTPNRMAWVKSPKREAHEIDVLTREEDRRLLAYQGTPNETFLVWFLRQTGLRVGEATSVRFRDLDTTQWTLRIRQSKTAAGRRTLPINPELRPRIDTWTEHLGELAQDPNSYVLSTRYGTAMHGTYVWRTIKRAAFKAGVRPVACTCGSGRSQWHDPECPRTASGDHLSQISPHTLRRTFGSDLLNRSASVETVSRLLGHTNVKVTQEYYAQLADETVIQNYHQAMARSA